MTSKGSDKSDWFEVNGFTIQPLDDKGHIKVFRRRKEAKTLKEIKK